MTHCRADGEGSQKVKIFTAGQTGKIGRTIVSPTQLPSRASAPIPRSFLSFPQIVKFSPLLSSKCLRANTSVPTEKGKRSPCGATVPTPPPLLCPTVPYSAPTVPTPPPLFLSPRPERTEDRTLGRACRIPIGSWEGGKLSSLSETLIARFQSRMRQSSI